jgi:hypothetical protein
VKGSANLLRLSLHRAPELRQPISTRVQIACSHASLPVLLRGHLDRRHLPPRGEFHVRLALHAGPMTVESGFQLTLNFATLYLGKIEPYIFSR